MQFRLLDGPGLPGQDREMARPAGFLSYLVACCAGWIQRHQAEAIEYLKVENRMLRGRLAGRRLVFTDAERRQLAVVFENSAEVISAR